MAHAHTLRSLIKHLDDISEEDIESLTIPTGTPLVYSLDRETLKPVRRRAMAGMRTSHVAIDEVPEITRPFDELCAVETAPIVETQTIGREALQKAAARHDTLTQNQGKSGGAGGLGHKTIEDTPYEKIKLCNKSWRIMSGPGIIEDAKIKEEHRRLGEDANFGGTMVFLTEDMLRDMRRRPGGGDGQTTQQAADDVEERLETEAREVAKRRRAKKIAEAANMGIMYR